MRSLIATLQELTVPMGAGLSRPSIYLGPRVPAEVAAYYSPDTVTACLIFRQNSQTYLYMALVQPTVGLIYVAVGGIESVGLVVSEALRWRLHGGFGNNPTSTDIAGALTIDGTSAPRGYLGANAATGGTLATSASGEVFVTPWDAQPTFTWKKNRIYRLDAQVHVVGTAAGNPYRVRVYHGANLLLAFDGQTGATTGATTSLAAVGWAYNSSGADITGTLTMSIQRTGGAGNVSLYGDSLIPLSVACSDATEVGSSLGVAARSL